MAEAAPILEARGLRKTFDVRDRVILDGVSLAVSAGEAVAVTGPSGCGKTTLLSILAGLVPPDAGSLIYRFPGRAETGRLTPALRRAEIGIVFQSIHLIPTLTVAENVEVPLFGTVPERRAREARAREVREMVGLGGAAGWQPTRLSGGERQRVAVARAFVNRPALVFADEPTGNLDTASSDVVIAALLRMTTEMGGALVLVTHNRGIAARLDRELTLVDGRITESRRPAAAAGGAAR
jgi:putative ABC transport system ATP-binding protein